MGNRSPCYAAACFPVNVHLRRHASPEIYSRRQKVASAHDAVKQPAESLAAVPAYRAIVEP